MRTRTFPALGFDPAPGSAADAEAVLTRLDHAAESVDGSAHGLRRAARSGSWQGASASAFRAGSAATAGGLDEAVTALRTASRTVSAWQSRLTANQREADELEAQARALRGATQQTPEQVAEQARALDRVLDRARRLQARHLRQASAAAAALRSATASVPGWPAAGTGRHAGQVSWWTGDVAAGLNVPVRPPAGGALPGDVLPGDVLPGQEGGFAVPVAGLPGTPGPDEPGLDPGAGPDLGGLLPGDPVPGRWPDLATEHLPGLPPQPPEPAATSPAGWLDTGHAPAVRPALDHLPTHRPLPDATPAGGATPDRHVSAADVPAREVSRGRTVHTGAPARPEPAVRIERHVENAAGKPAAHQDSGDREGAARTSGHGGEEHGPARFGGHAVSAPAGGPNGPGGVVDPPAHHGPAGGSPTPTTGTPPPLPAPPLDQTVEQQATPAPAAHDPGGARPDPGRAVDTARPDPVRAPEPGRLPEPGRAAAPALPPPDALRAADAGRGLEPGRLTGADPGARQASPGHGQGPQATKTRDGDDDPSAFLFGPLPTDTTGQPARTDGLRAFLMTRPAARPVLVLIKPGSGGEPLFLTGLTPCARPLPGCAAALPTPGPTTVY